MPFLLFRHIMASELCPVLKFVHHQADLLCIWRPTEESRARGRQRGCRLYFFNATGALGKHGHSYSHFLDCDALFELAPGDFTYEALTRQICGLADRYVEQVVRSALMGVACEFVRLSPEVHAFAQKHLAKVIPHADIEVWPEPCGAVTTAGSTLLQQRESRPLSNSAAAALSMGLLISLKPCRRRPQ